MLLHDIKLDKSLKFINDSVRLPSSNKRKYTCSVCKEIFTKMKALFEHKRTHTKQDVALAKKRLRTTPAKKQARSPLKPTPGKNTIKNYFPKAEKHQLPLSTHKCETCGTVFGSIEEIKNHPPNKCLFVCGVCRRSYNTIYAFIVHVLQHKINIFKTVVTPDKLHKCLLCPESFDDYIDLKTHGILMHKVKSQLVNKVESDSAPAEAPDDKTEISCELCFDIFDSAEELTEHMEFHKQLGEKQDEEVAATSSTDMTEDTEELKETQSDDDVEDDDTELIVECITRSARVELHPIPVIESSYSLADEEPDEPTNKDPGPSYIVLPPDETIPRKQYKCKVCERIYTTIEEYEGHVATACTIEKTCPVCFVTVDSNSEWYTHITEKHRRWATCKYCFVTFNEIIQLDQHKKVKHFNTFKNVCKICYKCFQTYQEFNDHLQKEHLNV